MQMWMVWDFPHLQRDRESTGFLQMLGVTLNLRIPSRLVTACSGSMDPTMWPHHNSPQNRAV